MSVSKIDTIRGEIDSAYTQYLSAVSRQSGFAVAKERLKNVLVGYVGDLIPALSDLQAKEKELKEVKEERDMLAAALQDADEENAKLRKNASKSGK